MGLAVSHPKSQLEVDNIMKRKARVRAGIDNREVALYARKSRITNKGDSIGVQFKQSADYAVNQLSLQEDYEFKQYEDKGLSGYYSDRPDFQRLLRDIEMGKIKAVACYKLDRISRKTSDLMRLLEYFERHDVTLLVCSNNINTQISTSKIIIQVLAIIAEFERDILTERIQDNLVELAKDGRWLGGATPTGFASERVTTGSGKNKSAVSFLVPVSDEAVLVREIYSTFRQTRSLLQTSNQINEKYATKRGAKFTPSSIRLILRNPIYCVADDYSHNYFLEHDGNLFGELSEFDGQHGLSAYNKTDQVKVEDEDSTFLNPKFSQLSSKKPISEWIIAVGRHEGLIPSRKWVETQNMLDAIAEKYNRPHRKTNALLSGLMYCPVCGKRLRVTSESDRWTNGKPRFKYTCPGVREKTCTFRGVEGVSLDEFVVRAMSDLHNEQNDYYRQIFESRITNMIRTDQGEQEYQETRKVIERLNSDIAAQVRNLREADDALKRFIQDDVKELTEELARREAALRRMEDAQAENQYVIHELGDIKKKLLSFEEYAKDAQPEVLLTLLHAVIDRIYITTEGSTQKCHIFIKGCATEEYSDLFGAADYIAEDSTVTGVFAFLPPLCDSDYYSIGYLSF
jgi:Site-specific recombinases, DNA invertase Pin homologs